MYGTSDLSAETLAALVDASAVINETRELDETLDAIARTAAAVMRAEASSVIMFDKARKKQVFRAAVGDRATQLVGMEYDEDAGVSGMVMRTGRPTIVGDVTREDSHFKEIDQLVGFETRSLIVAPLTSKGDRLGVVELINPIQGGEFTEKDMKLAQVFANLAAIAVTNAKLYDRLRKDNRGLRQEMRSQNEMIGTSPGMQEVRDLIMRVASSSATVLLLGETGTGKELAARFVHANSARSERPFIAVNCAALPRTLLESELFGHEAGAFTGATGRKLGRFELADGGTIFLDEVAEIAPDVQVKLLRVLQEKEIVRVGGASAIACDVRVIAATNRNLSEEMSAGRFRDDLFYRLNVFPIEIPPLRNRKEDIPLLAEHILKHLAGELKMSVPEIGQEAVAALARYDFPGNIRELQNTLERACLLCRGAGETGDEPTTIHLEHLPGELNGGQAAQITSGSVLAANEKAIITNALRESNWNQTKAAQTLGISRDNIRYRMKKYDIRRPE